jgi:hypothetical protein
LKVRGRTLYRSTLSFADIWRVLSQTGPDLWVTSSGMPLFRCFIFRQHAEQQLTMRNMCSNVSSGGWVEFQDFDMRYHSLDGSFTGSHSTSMWINALLDAAAKTGREPLVGPKLLDWARGAGFQGVTEHVFTFPIGRWPTELKQREVGILNLVLILEGLEAFSLRLLCDVAGWDADDVHELLASVRDELMSEAFHAQIKL